MFKLVDKNADELMGALGLTVKEFIALSKKCAKLTAKNYNSQAERIVDLQNENIEVLAFMALIGIDMIRELATIETPKGLLS